MKHGGTEDTEKSTADSTVIPAKAGIQERPASARGPWTPAFAGVTKSEQLSQDLVVQVAPCRIGLLDQPELPSSSPFLDALFPQDGLVHRRVKLGIDESMDGISLAETLDTICSVFRDTTAQVAGYS